MINLPFQAQDVAFPNFFSLSVDVIHSAFHRIPKHVKQHTVELLIPTISLNPEGEWSALMVLQLHSLSPSQVFRIPGPDGRWERTPH